jgi:prepilin signal peptidase PulO-like enzyme (type II secretory pathway)
MHAWTALATAPAGAVAGWFMSALSARYCDPPSRARRLAAAAVTAAVCAAFGWRFGPDATLPAYLYLGAAGTLLAFIDVAVRRLPDLLTLPSYVIGAALFGLAVPFTADGGARFGYALIGMAALWLLYGVQYFFAPSQIGLGDVKLAGVLGLYLGWLGPATWLLGMVLGFVFGALVALGLLAARKVTRKSELPFGPYMIAGAITAMLVGGPAAPY